MLREMRENGVHVSCALSHWQLVLEECLMRSANCQTDGGAHHRLGIYLVEHTLLFLRQQGYLIVYFNTRTQPPRGLPMIRNTRC